jgi:hypothetical protein
MALINWLRKKLKAFVNRFRTWTQVTLTVPGEWDEDDATILSTALNTTVRLAASKRQLWIEGGYSESDIEPWFVDCCFTVASHYGYMSWPF